MHGLRVMLVDDDESVRRLLSVALPLVIEDIEIVGEAGDGYQAVAVAAETSPDLIILDHMMPRRTGAEAVPDLRRVAPDSEILFFTAYIDAPEIGTAIHDVTTQFNLEAISKGGLADLESAVVRAAGKKGC